MSDDDAHLPCLHGPRRPRGRRPALLVAFLATQMFRTPWFIAQNLTNLKETIKKERAWCPEHARRRAERLIRTYGENRMRGGEWSE